VKRANLEQPDLNFAVDSSTQAEINTFSDKTKKKIERITSELLSNKKNDLRNFERSKKIIDDIKIQGKRKKFHSFSKKSELCENEGFGKIPRRNLSTDIRRNKKNCEKLGNVKSYMKMFHKKSKFLLDCLQKSILNK
jgi:hypothetical protein